MGLNRGGEGRVKSGQWEGAACMAGLLLSGGQRVGKRSWLSCCILGGSLSKKSPREKARC